MIKIPAVDYGQIWADNDPRNAGRTIGVDRIRTNPRGELVADCTILTDRNAATRSRVGRRTTIAVRRFTATSNGYRFVERP
jgi:hypothetical protein